MIAEELQLPGAVSGVELLQKQPAEQFREYWDREQVARPARDPFAAVARDAATRHALSIFRVAKEDEIPGALDAAKKSGAAALNVLASSLLFSARKTIIPQVARLRLPAIYQWPGNHRRRRPHPWPRPPRRQLALKPGRRFLGVHGFNGCADQFQRESFAALALPLEVCPVRDR
jgi:hypothetical protein